MRIFFRLFALFFITLAPTQVYALQSEALSEVTIHLHKTWKGSCIRFPLGSHEFASEASGAPTVEGVLSFRKAKDLAAWAETGVIKTTFSNRAGEPAHDIPNDGGKLVVELLAVDDPLIEKEPDGSSACLMQGSFENIHPTSIVPVTLDDARPGRVYFFTYKANWSPYLTQRHGLKANRIAAVLVSFEPWKGWSDIEAVRTADAGETFPSDTFSRAGLAHFDFEATHPDTIEIVGVPSGYPATHEPLTVRYTAPVPAAAAACRERDPWEVTACLDNLAHSGAILGALGLCGRRNTDCLVDLLYAPHPDKLADWCPTGPGDWPRCQAFAALHSSQDQKAEALPKWPLAKLVRSQSPDKETAFFLRALSIEYGPLKEFERSDKRRRFGTPYLKLSCKEGQLAASMLYAAHLPLWQPDQDVAVSVEGPLRRVNDFILRAGSDGTTLTVDDKRLEKFLHHVLSSQLFTMTTSGDNSTRIQLAVRLEGTTTVGGVVKDLNHGVDDLPTLLSAAGCSKAIKRILQ